MQLNSYLMFDGNCEAAFRFYEQCLGGKITMMMTHKEAPSAENVSPDWHDKIMHACLELKDRLLMGRTNFSRSGRKQQSENGDRSNLLVCLFWHVN